MKLSLFPLMSVAAAAMTFTACSEADDLILNETKGKSITLVAENPAVNNGSRTEIGTDGSAFFPLWSKSDFIYVNEDTVVRNDKNKDAASRTASFEYTPKEGETELLAVYTYGVNSPAIHQDSIEVHLSGSTPVSAVPNLSFDFMVSKKVPVTPDTKQVSLQFKRLSSVFRMNFITDISELDNRQVKSFDIKGIPGLEEGWATYKSDGSFVLIPEIKDCYVIYFKAEERPDGVRLPYLKEIKDYYLGCFPVNAPQGTKGIITIVFDDFSYLTKEITIGEKGLVFAAGTLNTVNVHLKDFTITTTAPGQIKPEQLKGLSKIKVNGPLNGQDMKYIREADIQILDLSGARLVKSDHVYYTYTDQNGASQECRLTEDNFLGDYMFKDKRYLSLILPESITKIGKGAFSSIELTELVIPAGVTHLSEDFLGFTDILSRNTLKKLTIMSDHIEYTQENPQQYRYYAFTDLYINENLIKDIKIIDQAMVIYGFRYNSVNTLSGNTVDHSIIENLEDEEVL